MSEDNWSNLPVWLPKKMDAIGLTVEQTAQKTGVSRTVMYAYLTDESRPTEQTAVRLARVLGVKFEELLAQYVPKQMGRPRGSGGTHQLKVRRK